MHALRVCTHEKWGKNIVGPICIWFRQGLLSLSPSLPMGAKSQQIIFLNKNRRCKNEMKICEEERERGRGEGLPKLSRLKRPPEQTNSLHVYVKSQFTLIIVCCLLCSAVDRTTNYVQLSLLQLPLSAAHQFMHKCK